VLGSNQRHVPAVSMSVALRRLRKDGWKVPVWRLAWSRCWAEPVQWDWGRQKAHRHHQASRAHCKQTECGLRCRGWSQTILRITHLCNIECWATLLCLSSSFRNIPLSLVAKAPRCRLRLPRSFARAWRSVFLCFICQNQLMKRRKPCLPGSCSRHVWIAGCCSEFVCFWCWWNFEFPWQTCKLASLGRPCTWSNSFVRILSRNVQTFSCRLVPRTALIAWHCHTLLFTLFQLDKTLSSHSRGICEAELVFCSYRSFHLSWWTNHRIQTRKHRKSHQRKLLYQFLLHNQQMKRQLRSHRLARRRNLLSARRLWWSLSNWCLSCLSMPGTWCRKMSESSQWWQLRLSPPPKSCTSIHRQFRSPRTARTCPLASLLSHLSSACSEALFFYP